jgi:FKBP-type peptidyl-prolyl cis-trans isomerase
VDILYREFSRVGRLCLSLAVSVALPLAASGCGSDTTTAPTVSVPFTQIEVTVGTGATANTGNTVRVSYTGWVYDAAKTNGKGTQFDTSASYSFLLGAGNVIKGWDQGVVGMRVGGTRRLTIPPELAYGGTSPSALIPANANLVFDITLLSVQ